MYIYLTISDFRSENMDGKCGNWDIRSVLDGLIVQLILEIIHIGIRFDAFQPQGKDDIQMMHAA